jgi:hypothetical protein
MSVSLGRAETRLRKERTSGAKALKGLDFYGTAEAVPFVRSKGGLCGEKI